MYSCRKRKTACVGAQTVSELKKLNTSIILLTKFKVNGGDTMKTYQEGLRDAKMLRLSDRRSTEREIESYRKLAKSFNNPYFYGLARGLCMAVEAQTV